MQEELQITWRHIEPSEALEIGTEVRFAEAMGDEGPQASSVSVIGKHHLPG